MINYFWVSIKGKNIKRILIEIIKNNINLLDVKYKEDYVLIKISYDDYKKLKNIKTTYQISIIKTSGKKRINYLFYKYKIPIIFFMISILFLVFLTNLTLFININTYNNSLKSTINKELTSFNIKPFSFKKNYDSLKKISTSIKNNNLNTIEWIEFDQKGVFLNVKVIERVKKYQENKKDYVDIVAAKNGYIRKIYSRNGEILKNIDDYVKKEEVIISGNIFKNKKQVGKVRASGEVYAEVWYIVKINKNINYINLEEKKRGRIKLNLNINNHNIAIISIPKKIDKVKSNIIFKNNFFNLSFVNEKKYQKKPRKYSKKELSIILNSIAKDSINKNLKEGEYIINQKPLKKYIKNDKMYMEVFFSTYENIAKEKPIQKIEEIKEEKE